MRENSKTTCHSKTHDTTPCHSEAFAEESKSTKSNEMFRFAQHDNEAHSRKSTKETTQKKVLIIGAGPAGLSAARILVENGYQVQIFELDSKVGGMSKSFPLFNQIVDIGPHRFFSKDKRLNDFWHAHTNGEFEKVNRLTRIFYNKKFFYYPLRGFDALMKLGIIESSLCVLSYIKAKISPFQGNSFESWVANAFGYRLYSIFFKSYTEKLWGIKCSELDSDFAAQRIKGLNLYEAAKAAFFGGGGKKHKTLVDEFSYPKKGCGVVYENMKDEIIRLGGEVLCDTKVLGIKTSGKKAVGIITNKGEFSGDIVISSAPFNEMVMSLQELDSQTLNLAKKLKFRNTILVYVEVGNSSLAQSLNECGNSASVTTDKVAPSPRFAQHSNLAQDTRIADLQISESSAQTNLTTPNSNSKISSEKCGLQEKSQGSYLEGNDRRDFSPLPHLSPKAELLKTELFKDNWIYVHDKNTATGRITNFANWTKDLKCGSENAILCLEYWANDDEKLWNLSDNELIEIAKNDLLESKLVPDSNMLINARVVKIHKSYPVYERGYKEDLHKIYKALDDFKDLYFIGRNGSFKYNNQDHSILMGLMCADKILGKECDLWHINTDYDYQEGKAEEK